MDVYISGWEFRHLKEITGVPWPLQRKLLMIMSGEQPSGVAAPHTSDLTDRAIHTLPAKTSGLHKAAEPSAGVL